MKKTVNNVMRKDKIIKKLKPMGRITAVALAITLAATTVMNSVVDRMEAAENADTLMGIEKLRNQYAEGGEYVILEVVPQKSGAEIGYLFDGYEPLLSTWDEEKQEWVSWKSRLIDIAPEQRAQFIADKTKVLQDYYTAIGIGLTDKAKMPVVIPSEQYEESDTPQDGYEEIKADDYESRGYFTLAADGAGKYQLSFNPERNKKNGEAYYLPTQETEIKEDTYESIADDMPVYTRYWDGNDLVYEYEGLMSECREKIEESFGNPDILTGQGKNDGTADDDESGEDKRENDEKETDDSEENDANVGNEGNEGNETVDGDENETGDSEGTDNKDDGSGNNDANEGKEDNGSDTQNDVTDTNPDNADENNQANASAKAGARASSALQAKWTKLVNLTADDGSSAQTGSADGDASNDGGSSDSGSGKDGNNSGSNGDGNNGGSDGGENNSGNTDDGSGDDGNDSGNTDDGNDSGNGENGNDDGSSGDGTDSGSGDDGNGSGNNGDGDDAETGDGSGNDDAGDGEDIDNKDDADKDKEDEEESGDKEKEDDDKDSKTDGKKKSDVSTKAVSNTETYYLVDFARMTTAYYEENRPAYFYSVGNIIASQSGQYSFIEDDASEDTQMYTLPDKVIYCKGVFRNNEWFKHYVLNMSADNFNNFKVKVITLTPSELNEMYRNNEVPEFNFLYLNSGLRSYADNIGGNGDNAGDTEPGTGEDGNGDSAPNPNENQDNTGDDGNHQDDNANTGDDSNHQDDNANTGEDNNGQDDNTNAGDDSNHQDDNANTDEDNNGQNDNTNVGDDSNAQNGDDNPDNGNTVSASKWVSYVSTAKSSALTESDNTDTADGADASDSKDKTGGEGASDNKDKTDSEDASDNKDNTDSEDASDSKDKTDGEDASDNKDNTDGEDASDNKDKTDGEDTPDNNDTPEDEDASEGKDTEDDASEDGNAADDEKDTENRKAPIYTGLADGNKAAEDEKTIYAEGNDSLTNEVINYLYKEAAAKALPCLVDGAIVYELNKSGVAELRPANGGTAEDADGNTIQNQGLFRLALMMCQDSLETDYSGVSNENLLKAIEDADGNFTTDQVYCRFGNGTDSIINSDFFAYTFYQDKGEQQGEVVEGFQKVLDEITLENLYRESDTSGSFKPLSTNIGQAETVRHILNYQNRRTTEPKESIKVLDIEPALTTDEYGLSEAQVKTWAPGVKEVEIIRMTTAEFIGKIEKLNETYDLIYIGTSKEYLNIINWVTGTGKSENGKYQGSTVFNDSDMDGLIYYNIGDKRVVSQSLAGLLTTEYWDNNRNNRTYYYNFARYSGNDITEEKVKALISFLDGSYPIIVSEEFIEQPVTVFNDADYKGLRVSLSAGNYEWSDLRKLGIQNDQISSIKVKDGYKITVYQNDHYEGFRAEFTKNVNNLVNRRDNRDNGSNWNDDITSLTIERVDGEMPVRAIDEDHIDNSSYMYEFVDKAMKKGYMNFYAESDIEDNSELFKFYLNRPKASLVDFSTEAQTGDSAINDVYYIYPNAAGRYTLQYSFTIRNEGAASMDTRYRCKLYIDVNADGKFSDSEEVSDITMLNMQAGGAVSPDELYAGTKYRITREVPTGYKGLLPWKIEVCQINNDNIYTSEIGYTKLQGLEKEVLKVCQIYRYALWDDKHINLDWEINNEDARGSHFDILVNGGWHDGVYYEGIRNDFDLQIDSMDINEFTRRYNENNDYLNGYNMLILGFSDGYGDFEGDENWGPMSAIVKFINSGKSVLMAHDTTSYFNAPADEGTINRNWYDGRTQTNYWRNASTLNRYVRPIVGMDRYGVLKSDVVKRGVTLREGDSGWNELIDSGKEVAYKPKSGRKETVPEAQGYTYSLITAKDWKADWDGDQNNTDYRGYNLYTGGGDNIVFTNRYFNQRFDTCYYGGWSDNRDGGEMNRNEINNGLVRNVHVTQVNKGQITEYPYKLQEDFEVAQTHGQYYQLDYTADDDKDGQSDLVVWYCLGERTADGNGGSATVYSQSPNDVRNNYYIYNKGNITYTGMGHSREEEDRAKWYTFEEAKLFINTMIASYQAGVKPPMITALESGTSDAAQLTTLYRHYDDVNMLSLSDAVGAEGYEKVYFTVRDVNFVKGTRDISARAYYQDNNGSQEIKVDGATIRVNPLDYGMYNASDDSLANPDNLASGGIYYILVPKTVMNKADEAGGLDLYFEAWSIIETDTTTVNRYETDKVYAKVNVLKTFLFNLD